jgi:hypothetical protein
MFWFDSGEPCPIIFETILRGVIDTFLLEVETSQLVLLLVFFEEFEAIVLFNVDIIRICSCLFIVVSID